MIKIFEKNYINKKFNSLKIISFSHRDKKSVLWVNCICDCGVKKSIRFDRINSKSKPTKSCGCANILAAKRRGVTIRTHGMSGKLIYHLWRAMKQRCYNKKTRCYYRYGAKGISVCKRWHKFENFYKDMGEKPNGMSLDRIDPNGNYNKKNCRWATPGQQARNTVKYKTKKDIGVIFKEHVNGMPLNMYVSRIGVNNKTIHIGCYKTKKEAIEVRKQAEQLLWK